MWSIIERVLSALYVLASQILHGVRSQFNTGPQRMHDLEDATTELTLTACPRAPPLRWLERAAWHIEDLARSVEGLYSGVFYDRIETPDPFGVVYTAAQLFCDLWSASPNLDLFAPSTYDLQVRVAIASAACVAVAAKFLLTADCLYTINEPLMHALRRIGAAGWDDRPCRAYRDAHDVCEVWLLAKASPFTAYHNARLYTSEFLAQLHSDGLLETCACIRADAVAYRVLWSTFSVVSCNGVLPTPPEDLGAASAAAALAVVTDGKHMEFVDAAAAKLGAKLLRASLSRADEVRRNAATMRAFGAALGYLDARSLSNVITHAF